MTLNQILTKARTSDAIEFEQFLTQNKINNTWLDVCITDYNQEYFNITLDDYDDYNIIFCDGIYEE